MRRRVLTNLLGADPEDKVLVVVGNWVEVRRMQSEDKEIIFEQHREADGEWLLTEFIEPEVGNWYWTAKNAYHMGLRTPQVAWLGPLESIPDELLLSDAPLQSRRVDKQNWINLRMAIKEKCEAEA
jgi:hypothetical protein